MSHGGECESYLTEEDAWVHDIKSPVQGHGVWTYGLRSRIYTHIVLKSNCP